MTLGIVLLCDDGVVVGSDKKVVQNKGVTIQRESSKTIDYRLANNNPLVCCYAGAKTVAERMLTRIQPNVGNFDSQEEPRFSTYMTEVVERRIPRFAQEYKQKHGEIPNSNIAMGTVLDDGSPTAATIYPNGTFDYEDRFTAIGSGSLLAELFLRDNYSENIDIEEGRKFVGYIIQRVSEVDSNVEGIEVKSINEEQTVQELDSDFVTTLQASSVHGMDFSMDIGTHLEELSDMEETYQSTLGSED